MSEESYSIERGSVRGMKEFSYIMHFAIDWQKNKLVHTAYSFGGGTGSCAHCKIPYEFPSISMMLNKHFIDFILDFARFLNGLIADNLFVNNVVK